MATENHETKLFVLLLCISPMSPLRCPVYFVSAYTPAVGEYFKENTLAAALSIQG